MTRPHLSTARLLWRHATAGLGASVTVMVVVFVVAALAVATPSAIQNLVTASVQHEVNALPVTARDLVADEPGGPVIGPSSDPSDSPFDSAVDAVWGNLEDGLASVRSEMPPALERSLGDASYAVTLVPNRAGATWSGAPVTEISLGFDPRIMQHITIVSGQAPQPMTELVPNTQPTQIMLSETIATRMEWELGEVRTLRTPDGSQPLELSGTFEPRDASDPYWTHIPASLTPSIEVVGLAPPVVIGVGFAEPGSWAQVEPFSAGARMRVWYPVETGTLTAANAAEFATGVREFTRAKHQIGELSDTEWTMPFTKFPVTGLSFGSRVTVALDDAIATTSATSAVLAMTASGPVGVILAVLVLGAGLIRARRSAGLNLAAARGASRRQLRASLALEGLFLGIPAAALGAGAGALLVPGELGPLSLLLPATVAILPAVLLAAAPIASGARRVRTDLGRRAGRRWRWVIEALVLGVSALAVLLLYRRGVGTSVSNVAVDPLLAAVPLLLSLAACVLVMRLYPLPLAGLFRRARRGPKLVAFLGAARGLRDPEIGLAPVLSMVVGVSVAVFSGAMLSTVDIGVNDAARSAVGADLLVSSQAITAAQAEEIAETDGVNATAPVYAEVRVTLTHDGERDYVTVIVIDAEELANVQGGQPGAVQNLDALTASTQKIPVIASQDVADLLAGSTDAEIDTTPVEVVGTAPSVGPLSDRRAWVVADRSHAQELVGTIYSPARIFVALDDDAVAAEVRDSIRSIVQDSALVAIPQDESAELRANPAVSGLQTALIAALLVISFLCTVAILMTLARGRRSRERLVSMLRTLGLGRRTATGLVAWELAPMTVVALVAGTALGLTLPLIVHAGVDVTLFTGGAEQPALAVDPLLTAAITGGFVLLVLAATTIAVITSRRVDPAATLRTIEE